MRAEQRVARRWIARALVALADPDAALTRAGLATNFAFDRVPEAERGRRIVRIAATYARAGVVLLMRAHTFTTVTEEEARAVFPGAADIPPAYAIFGDRVYVTPRFARFGPMCRAAMLLHESVHVVDPASGAPEVHVSEWDEPRFSSLGPDEQEHNPSAYASFAAQMHERALRWPRDARYGAGQPDV